MFIFPSIDWLYCQFFFFFLNFICFVMVWLGWRSKYCPGAGTMWKNALPEWTSNHCFWCWCYSSSTRRGFQPFYSCGMATSCIAPSASLNPHPPLLHWKKNARTNLSPLYLQVVASMDWPEVTKYRGLVSAQTHREEIIQDLYNMKQDPKRGVIHGGMIRLDCLLFLIFFIIIIFLLSPNFHFAGNFWWPSTSPLGKNLTGLYFTG